MKIELTLQEAEDFIAFKIDPSAMVNILVPEIKSIPEPIDKSFRDDKSIPEPIDKSFRDESFRIRLVNDMKMALSVDKMFAIRYLRLSLPEISLKEAKVFTEMPQVALDRYIKTGEFLNSYIIANS
jgi:hypothetical protein